MGRGCLVCVISNPNSGHSFIFKLCIMIVHTLEMCYSYFVYISSLFFLFLGSGTLIFFFCKMLRGRLVCVTCNSISFHSLIFKLFRMIINTLNMYTSFLCTFDKHSLIS